VLERAVFVFAISALALACSGGHPANVAGANPFSADVVRDLGRGVFEVVVPKVPDGGVVYSTPPDELVSVRLRNEKFLPLGTAFAISPTLFVTAAHVVNAVPESSLHLRDSTGTTYEVSRVLKLSDRRDLAVFELVRAPADVHPLEVRTSIAVGESVFTVGNAGGEGIVIRGGTLTPPTPERVNGEWNDLRFTSPASPGNSGGPLVDAAGRVVGAVVGGNPVNALNVAIPMGELDKLASDYADRVRTGLQIKQDLHETFFDATYTVPLPSTVSDYHRAGRDAFLAAIARSYADFDAKYGAELFPNHPALTTFLQEAGVPRGFGTYAIDGNGTWVIVPPAQYRSARAGASTVFLGTVDRTHGELLLDRPPTMPFATFFDSPNALGGALVRSESWSIPFSGREIGIKSLGAPHEKERWVDEQGRPWFTFVWRIERTRESVIFDCLTDPAGWACKWNRAPRANEDTTRLSMKRWARRVTFGYWGLIKDWTEYLALPDAYKPKVFDGASIRFDKDLAVNVGPLVGEHVTAVSLSAESALYASVALTSSTPHVERIIDVYVTTRVAGSTSFGVREVLAPLPGSPDVQVKRWTSLQNGSAPFDDAVVAETASTNAIKRGVRASPAPGGRPRMLLEYCRNGATEPKTDLQAMCVKFRDTLKHDARP
jgi:serine protease Do